ncbi:MAG: hypothetical protein ACYDG4_09335 [Desulfuromonadaceae bacterium]
MLKSLMFVTPAVPATGRLVFEKDEKLLGIERELLSGLKSMRENKSIAFICTTTFGIVHLPDIMREFMMEFNDLADLSFMFDTPGKIAACSVSTVSTASGIIATEP